MKIPMSSPDINQADKDAVREVLDSRWLSGGPKVREFEERFADYIGVKHAVAVSSGTAGLHLAVKIAYKNTELLTTSPFSFVASSNAILYEYPTIEFVDIFPDTLNIDVRNHYWGNGVLAVDILGQPWDADQLPDWNFVIEDACEAIGAEYKGRKAGTLGDISVFAFYPNKQMTTGEGGMICTDNDEWASLCRSWRNQGRGMGDYFDHVRLGYNYRMDEMSAALGISQLSRIDELLEKREQVAHWYNERLKDTSVELPYIADYTTRMSWFVYVIRTDNREDLIENLTAAGIPTRTYFKPIHLMPMYGYERGSFPNAERAGDRCLALPFSGVMTEEEVEFVCQYIR